MYGVIPDQSGGCATGCGNDPSPFNNLCAVSSHELSEMVTDPAVGLATTYASPLSWYDPTNGEVADMCSLQGTTLGSNGVVYTIQQVFSNKAGKCVSSPPSTTTTTTTTMTTMVSTITTTKSTTTTTTTTTSTPTTSTSCVHSKCVTGVKLASGCDPCVTKIIQADSYCGNVYWDSICVSEVKKICGISPCV